MDPDPGGQKLPTKIEKSPEFSCFSVLYVLSLRAEGFSCSLGVLYGGLGRSNLQFLIKKIEIKFPAINIFQFQVINPWIRIRNQKKCWIRICIRIRIKSMRIRNPDDLSTSTSYTVSTNFIKLTYVRFLQNHSYTS
jgi:hypothetical protein